MSQSIAKIVVSGSWSPDDFGQHTFWQHHWRQQKCWILFFHQGIARTQFPTNKNYVLELPTFGVIVGVSLTGVQWRGLALEEPPSWSWLTSAPGKYAWAQFGGKTWVQLKFHSFDNSWVAWDILHLQNKHTENISLATVLKATLWVVGPKEKTSRKMCKIGPLVSTPAFTSALQHPPSLNSSPGPNTTAHSCNHFCNNNRLYSHCFGLLSCGEGSDINTIMKWEKWSPLYVDSCETGVKTVEILKISRFRISHCTPHPHIP